ncbi:hypothetical protein ACH4RA_33555 [Streptomyces smyrnaeus]|uniref:hypothetical protein n=1 Tax=Streptomyces TaxID=1883 RepID=UPI000C19C58F|nr:MULTISPECIES: hypothetical protein [unclassified Streptomyces]MBQ0868408.1 hypothetical protein [Streptomyces sp. RK75]MBQ1123465.1 hypothetical protein [Streptomyces sp. B15]MBQ1158922.1 hypothetical protein [Streptomyces sp. A73]
MRRPSAVLAAGLISLALLTACSDEQKDGPSRAGSTADSSAPSVKASEDKLEKQDEVPDEWPPEIPLPLGYKIKAGSEPTQGEYHSAQVIGLPKKAVTATLNEFESNGFTQKGRSKTMNERGFFRFVNKKWDVNLTAAPMDKKGEPTMEDTGVYTLLYMVGPAE